MASTNKVSLDSTVSTIIKEEFIIPDDPVLHVKQEKLLDTSCKQISTTEPVGKREKNFVKKIKNRIQALNKIKSSDDVEIIFEKSSVPAVNACAPVCDNLKVLNNSITAGHKSRTKTSTSSAISILKRQVTIKNSNVHQNLENSSRRGVGTSILKIPNVMDKRTTITISNLTKNHLKPCLQAESVLKSVIKPVNSNDPLVLKLTKTFESENMKQVVDANKDKSTLHVLDMKEKQIVIKNNNFTEIKKEVIEANLDEQINRTKRFYHGLCFTCRKLKAPNDQHYKCRICSNTFHYECLRCRDVLTSQQEYFNHLKNGLYCSEIHVPAYMRNDSYALATRAEKHECSAVVWERLQKLVTLVKEARAKLKGEFNRIKSCCPVCDTIQHAEHGTFWCDNCKVRSVFKCVTCNRSYTTYSSAIHHTEIRMVKKPIFECNDCPFKHRRKRELIIHIRKKHQPMDPTLLRKRAKLVFQCPDCYLIIKSVSYWRKHAYCCREKVYYKCTLCPEKYLTRKEITMHLLVAHQMTDRVVAAIMKGIEQDRKIQAERKKKRKQNVVKSNKKLKSYRTRFVTQFCINCDSILDQARINKDNTCRKCKTLVRVQCTLCKKFFVNFRTSYYHIKNKCEKVRKANVNKKTDTPNREVNKNTQQLDLGYVKELENNIILEDTGIELNNKLGNTNNQFCHSILDSEAFMSNETELGISSTLEENEMQLDENNHAETEAQDIKVFDGLINFDNYEVIIPDKIEH